MTQKEKLKEATMMALEIRSIANNIRYDAKDYDTKWSLAYADRLECLANKFLKK